ncbi:hypothetical protein [Cohnella silvisoli]|uniref:Alpha-L-rhamnosidase six-hairpin glycosidase domain-containing protein n=1 Tax=Cohnella silvisoli TaxID=2873699 RepID=A0ABV1KT49_9BACL|nr:hypothetical protein [Cohnella silvisoli]MCD9021537.1 hypothetical protein [Cohnella silvisoli]
MKIKNTSIRAFIYTLLFSMITIPIFATTASAAVWDQYNLAPTTRTVSPISIYATNGTVQNPNNIITGGAALILGAGSYVVLDFGKEVGGIITVNFPEASSNNESVGLAFSESSDNVGTNSDSSNSAINAGLNYSTDGAVYASITTTGASSYTMPANKLRGGFRYLTIFMNSGGWVHVGQVSLNFTAVPLMSNPSAYPNYFYSNDDLINKLWYSGAYTLQTNTIVPTQGRVWRNDYGWDNSATISGGTSVLGDGAKRDRAVWPGDMGISTPTAYASINDTLSTKNALQRMFDSQNATTGELPYAGPPFNFGGSDSYHMWTLITTYNYYLYSGDLTWLNSVWTKYKLGMSYIRAKVNGSHGLLKVTSKSDWARHYDNLNNQESIAQNAMLYRSLITGAILANAEGDSTLATTYTNEAATLKANINSTLWDANQGAYKDNPTSLIYPQDGNSLAVWFDVPDSAAKSTSVSNYLKSNWSTYGSRNPEYDFEIATFPGSMEIQAHFKAFNDVDGLNLMRKEWGYMYNSPKGTKTFWESINQDGSAGYDWFTSYSHAWASGPTSALTFFVLGITPTTPKGQQYNVIPHPGDLTHVEGQLTMDGSKLVKVSYDRANNSSFSMLVDSTTNTGSSGVIGIPKFGANRTVSINGTAVWNGTSFSGSSGITSADQDANYIYFRGVQPGSRTFSYTGSQTAWINCAAEGNPCSFNGTKGVRYGSGTTFVYGTFTNGITCDNSKFGDPTSGVAKHCEISDTQLPPTPGIWTYCADENQQCSFSDTKTVAYGAQSKYNYGIKTSTAACTNAVFGDPVPNVAKGCYQSNIPSNAGFEGPTTADYIYNPASAGWTFSVQSGSNGAGIQRTGTGGSFYAAYAPEGAQTAFIQGTGSMQQTLTNVSAGTYAINFLAAKRQARWDGTNFFYGGLQTFNVYVDNNFVGAFSPASTSFNSFTSNTIALTTGNHTIKFEGTTTSGDNTDFIDSVGMIKY